MTCNICSREHDSWAHSSTANYNDRFDPTLRNFFALISHYRPFQSILYLFISYVYKNDAILCIFEDTGGKSLSPLTGMFISQWPSRVKRPIHGVSRFIYTGGHLHNSVAMPRIFVVLVAQYTCVQAQTKSIINKRHQFWLKKKYWRNSVFLKKKSSFYLF